jgi:hypothetical protein
MTNHHGEIDTTARKLRMSAIRFSDPSNCCRREFFRHGQAASSVESEVFEVAVAPAVLVGLSRRREQSS